ncbi:MAG: type II secretion system protein GspK [Verrucomicrobiota bacterium]|nr:type II secretion system protein GspK [Verrucomicrobiota bacterium]
MIAMYSSTKIKANRREGAVLLVVLGVILLASWMLVQIIGRVGEEVELRGVESQNDAIRVSAFQTLEIVIGVLAEIQTLDGGLYSPAQGWGDALGYAGFPRFGTDTNGVDVLGGNEETTIAALDDMAGFAFPPGIEVEVGIRDESGRLSLNDTSEERWKLLFEEMEIQSSDATTMVDSLLDWIDADDEPRLNGAEAGFYQRRDPPYLPANCFIEDLLDLQLIEGFDRLFFDERGVPNDLFRTFRDCVTTVGDGAVNYNTAHPLVLEVLAEELEFDAEKVADYVSGPDLERGTVDDQVLRPGLDDPDLPEDSDGEPLDFSATCRYLTVHITSWSAGTVFKLSARLDTETPSAKKIYPMSILDLQTKGSNL